MDKPEKIKKQALCNETVPVTVIIPTYNRSNDLMGCIESIKKQTHPPCEIIIIDDCSPDNTKDISIRYDTTYVRNSKRMGQSYGKNIGIKKARTDLVAFIDDDCIADENWLKNLLDCTIEEKNVGIVGGRIIGLSDKWERIEKIKSESKMFAKLLKYSFLKSDNVGKIYPNGFTDSNFNCAHYKGEVDWVGAGNMLVDKKITTVFFGENLKGNLRFEEPDFCLRAKNQNNIKILFTHDAIVWHKFSEANRIDVFGDLYLRKRNQMHFILKNNLLFKSPSTLIWFIYSHSLDVFIHLLLSIKNRKYFYAITGKIDGVKDFKKH